MELGKEIDEDSFNHDFTQSLYCFSWRHPWIEVSDRLVHGVKFEARLILGKGVVKWEYTPACGIVDFVGHHSYIGIPCVDLRYCYSSNTTSTYPRYLAA